MKIVIVSALVAAACAVTGCSGTRTTGSSFTTHAESFRVLGYAIPEDDQKAAMALVPKGGNVESVSSTPADWQSLWGVLGNLFWFHVTEVGGTLGEEGK